MCGPSNLPTDQVCVDLATFQQIRSALCGPSNLPTDQVCVDLATFQQIKSLWTYQPSNRSGLCGPSNLYQIRSSLCGPNNLLTDLGDVARICPTSTIGVIAAVDPYLAAFLPPSRESATRRVSSLPPPPRPAKLPNTLLPPALCFPPGCFEDIAQQATISGALSALQTLHKVSSKAREHNFFLGGLTHDWVSYYERRIESDRSCLNEWHTMDSLESRRPPSPDSVRTR
uniref:Slingshot N-terminal domain-containing protein n=1 Tax=Timema tahoe TaxID=61484 RepID=A0A7R9FMZ0_9NEOP|nr:unnamed protein product [Timema tahoe]